jgi:hypothetical protein
LGRIADLVKRLDPYSLKKVELDELAALLDSLTSINNTLVQWGFPGGTVREGPGIDITGSNRIGVGHDSILLVDSTSHVSAREYAVTSSGLDAALSSATSGDVILLPAQDISGNHTITAGVKVVGYSRYATILTGQITGGASSAIENLSVIRTANSSDTLKGVVSPASGTFYINGCSIVSTQSGSGNSYAVSGENNSSTIEIWNSYMYGSSGSGTGYGTYRDSGTSASLYVFGGWVRGSTNPCSE